MLHNLGYDLSHHLYGGEQHIDGSCGLLAIKKNLRRDIYPLTWRALYGLRKCAPPHHSLIKDAAMRASHYTRAGTTTLRTG